MQPWKWNQPISTGICVNAVKLAAMCSHYFPYSNGSNCMPHWQTMQIYTDTRCFSTRMTMNSFKIFADIHTAVNLGCFNQIYNSRTFCIHSQLPSFQPRSVLPTSRNISQPTTISHTHKSNLLVIKLLSPLPYHSKVQSMPY